MGKKHHGGGHHGGKEHHHHHHSPRSGHGGKDHHHHPGKGHAHGSGGGITVSNNNAAAQYLQAVMRAYVLRKSYNRDLLRARLEAYSKWTPVTFFRAYCKFAQQTTTARAFKGAKRVPASLCESYVRYLLHVSVPALHLLEDHLDEASFVCLCMDCQLISAVSVQYAISLFRHHSTCASNVLMNKVRGALVYESLGTRDKLQRALEGVHIAPPHVERCLAFFLVKAPTQQEIVDRLNDLGVFTEYRIVDQRGFEKLMTNVAGYVEEQEDRDASGKVREKPREEKLAPLQSATKKSQEMNRGLGENANRAPAAADKSGDGSHGGHRERRGILGGRGSIASSNSSLSHASSSENKISLESAAEYWNNRPDSRALKWLFWSNIAQTAEDMQRSQACSHRSFVGELLSNDGIRELLLRYDGVLQCAFKHFSKDQPRMTFGDFLSMATHLGLHPKIANDASNDWAITHVYLRAQQGVVSGLRHECVYEGRSDHCYLCRRKRVKISGTALLRLGQTFQKHAAAAGQHKRRSNVPGDKNAAKLQAELLKRSKMQALQARALNGDEVTLAAAAAKLQLALGPAPTPDGTGPGGGPVSNVAMTYLPLHLAQQVLLEWDPKAYVGRHLAMRLPMPKHSKKLVGYLTWQEFQDAVRPGYQMSKHVESTLLSFSEFVMGVLMIAQLQLVEIEQGLSNISAIKLLHTLTLVRRCPSVLARADTSDLSSAWATPTLHQRGLESVRKALHDQLYPIFRHYCSLGTVSQQSQKKLCLETFFLFVNDISLYAALGYNDFSWIVSAKMRKEATDEMTLFQFLMLNEECVAEDYILMEEFQASEQYTLAETSESGLCEHCMGVVDRLRMFFELYQFPSRLTNFKRAVVHVYTQSNISGKGRAKPRMRGIGAPPIGKVVALDLWSGGVVRHNDRNTTSCTIALADLHDLILDSAGDEPQETVKTDTESDDSKKSDKKSSDASSSSDGSKDRGDAAKHKATVLRKRKKKGTKSGNQLFRDGLFSYAHAMDRLVIFRVNPTKWQRSMMKQARTKISALAKPESPTRRAISPNTDESGNLSERPSTTLGRPRTAGTTPSGEALFTANSVDETHPARKLLVDAAVHARRGRLQQATIISEKALHLVSVAADEDGQLVSPVLEVLVKLSTLQNKFTVAARYMHMQLSVAQRDSSPTGVGIQVRILNALGKMHFESNHMNRAIECHSKQATLAFEIGDHVGEMLAYYNHGRALEALELFDDAILKYKHVAKLSRESDSSRGAVGALAALAALYYRKGDYEGAQKALAEKLQLLKQLMVSQPNSTQLLTSVVSSLACLAETYRHRKQHKLTFETLGLQLKESRRLGNVASECQACGALGQAVFAIHLAMDLRANPKFYVHLPKASDEEARFLARSSLLDKSNVALHLILPDARVRQLAPPVPGSKPMESICAEARGYLEREHHLAVTIEDRDAEEEALENLAAVQLLEENFDDAEQRLIYCLGMKEENGDVEAMAHIHGKLGLLAIRTTLNEANPIRRQKQLDKAVANFTKQLDVYECMHRECVANMPKGDDLILAAALAADRANELELDRIGHGVDRAGRATIKLSEFQLLQAKATTHSFVAAAHHLSGRHEAAIATHELQLQCAQDCQDATAVAAARASLGFVCRGALQKDESNDALREAAIEHYAAYLDWAKEEDDFIAQAHAHVCLSRIYASCGETNLEIQHIQEILTLNPHLKDVVALGNVHTRLATVSATVLLDDAHVLSDSDFSDDDDHRHAHLGLQAKAHRPVSRQSALSDSTSDSDADYRNSEILRNGGLWGTDPLPPDRPPR